MIVDGPGNFVPADEAAAMAAALKLLGDHNGGLPDNLRRRRLEFLDVAAAARGLPEKAVAAVPHDLPRRNLSDVNRLGVAAVARRLNCGLRNARDLFERGTLEGEKIAGRWETTPEQLNAYEERRA